MQLGIAGQAYQAASIDTNNQNCINWINTNTGPQGKGASDDGNANKCLMPTAGCKKLVLLPGQQVRNIINVRDFVYVVVDSAIYKLTINYISLEVSYEIIGELNTFTGIVKSAFNPTQIMFVDGSGFIYQDTGFELPVVTSVSPNNGFTSGTNTITISGSGFTTGTTVMIGDVSATTTVTDINTLSVVVPAYVSGNAVKDITVTTQYGVTVYSSSYTYNPIIPTITSISPTTGNIAGQTRVDMTGTNFIQGMSATIGSVPLTNITVTSGTTAYGYTGANTAATYSITVTNSAGSGTLSSAFTYTSSGIFASYAIPNTTDVNGGGTVTITGSNMGSATGVYFGNTLCTGFASIDANNVSATIPAYVSGSLKKTIRVVISSGNANNCLYQFFTYTPLAPTLSSISPTKGISLGGTLITLTGTNFTPTTTATINGIALTNIKVVNSTTLTGITPAQPIVNSNNIYDVVITNEVSSATLPSAFTYTSGIYQEINSPGFSTAIDVVFIAGYFVVAEKDSGKFDFSDLNEGLTWDSLSTATAESSPDNIVALGVSKGELWVLGEYSTEIWYNAGNPTGAPFSPREGLQLQIGCQAAQSVISLNDLLVWVDNRGYIVQSDVSAYLRNNNSGYDLQIISTDAMTSDMLDYIALTDCMAISYNDRGHLMGQFSFPTQKKTWVFDYLTKQWHERLYYSESDNQLEHHLGQFCTQYKNLTLIGGIRSGSIYISSHNYKDDDGVNIRRIRTTSFLYLRDDVKFLTIQQLALTIGQIDPIDLAQNPQIGLRYSKDGGHTWSNRIWRDLGKTGTYKNIITWNRIGNSRQWLFEFLVSDKISVALIDAWLNNEVET